MSAYTNQVKDYVERYKAETGNDGLLDPHEVAAWALQKPPSSKGKSRRPVRLMSRPHAQRAKSRVRSKAKGKRQAVGVQKQGPHKASQ